MFLSKMDSLSDEVFLVIYSYLEVKDLLVKSKVSVRHARLTLDKKMWKWTRIWETDLVRDEERFTGKGRSRTLLINLEGLAGDDMSWLFCRVQEVSCGFYHSSELDDVLRAIIREAGEGTCLLYTSPSPRD